MQHRTSREGVSPFVTKDGSVIRELMHPSSSASRHQSLAEATVPPGGRTTPHLHRVTEEIYHFLDGRGEMLLGGERLGVARGDTVVVPPGTPHGLENGQDSPLVLLCACAPAYSHDDTFLLDDEACEARLRERIDEAKLDAEQHVFGRSCHSVAEAAAAAGAPATSFVKTICMVAADGRLVAAVVKGEDRASPEQVAEALGLPAAPRLAKPHEMLARTLFPAGGTPPFGFDATFLVDERVLETEVVWGGGGSARALVKAPSAELVRANGGLVARVRRDDA